MQRVFLARAIVNEPELLLLDEPTAGVDARGRAEFLDLLAGVAARDDVAVVLVTHNAAAAHRLADRVVYPRRPDPCLGQARRKSSPARLGRAGLRRPRPRLAGGPALRGRVMGEILDALFSPLGQHFVRRALAAGVALSIAGAHRNRPRRPPTDGPFLYAGVPAVSFPPRVLAQRAGRPVIQLDGRDLAMTSARAGALEGVIRVPEGTRFSGWAIDEEASLPAREVVILANGRLIGRARPSAPRRDLAKTNERLLSSGWSIVVPANGSLHGRIRLFAVMADGTARELNYLQPYPFATGSGGSTP